jgi:hypothetical protein
MLMLQYFTQKRSYSTERGTHLSKGLKVLGEKKALGVIYFTNLIADQLLVWIAVIRSEKQRLLRHSSTNRVKLQ